LAVQFTATATDIDGQVASLEWSFGDGASSSGSSVSHTYRAAGGFKAEVTATDNEGATGTASVAVSAFPLPGPSIEQDYPTRLAEGPQGKIYVTDAKLGSVVIYDAALSPVGEIGDLDLPLAVAVDSQGRVYVGSDGGDRVEVYSSAGDPLSVIDDGGIQMPNDMAIDADDNLYVVDSLGDTVRVYNAGGTWLRNIGAPGDGDGGLRFPAAATIAYTGGGAGPAELYVADQGHATVQVFDLAGNFLRSFGGPVGAFSPDWQGLFVRLQSLAIDGLGALHAADSFASNVQIVDPDTGAYLIAYGGHGAGVGELDLPLDLLVTQSGQAVIADTENHRIQVFSLLVP
jgi:sugar lactone lactonase YvrE